MPSDVFPDIRQLSDEELLRQKQIQQQRAAERNAKIAKAVDDFSSRTAEGQAARREAVGNAINNVKDVGKALYYFTLGSTDPNNPYAQQQAQTQHQPVQQPQIQAPPAQATTPPSQPVRPVVQRPVQRPVAKPQQRVAQPAPVQQPQQQIDPNIIMDMINEYQDPNYEESAVYSSPVAEGANDKIINDLIQEGENPEQSNKQSTVADILNQIKSGYSDNRDNGFALENLQADPTKTGWNRFGEALGTATRMAGNPLVQGLAAGAINGAINKDWGKGLEYGLQYAQNKAKSDAYERAMGKRPSVLGGYGVEDYKAKNEADYKQNKMDIENQELDLKKTKQDYDIKNIESQIKDREVRQQQGWAKIQEQITNNRARLAEAASNHAAVRAIQQSKLLDSQAKFAFTIENKQYTNARNIIMNDKTINDDEKAKRIYALDNNFADSIRDKYGIDYRSVKEQVSNSGTKPQAQQNTQSQVNTDYKKAEGNLLV